MKNFDICLMNPPYDRSLHLKFLEKAIAIAEKVVSIQPVRWLEESVNKDKKSVDCNKYEESISKHIKDLEIINADQAKKDFNIFLVFNIGIYLCDKNGGYNYKLLSSNTLLDKIISYIKENLCNFEYHKKDGYRVRVPFIVHGSKPSQISDKPTLPSLEIKNIIFKDGKKDNKWWYEYYSKNQHSKNTEEITSSIKFNSEEEAQNFINSLDTDFGRYIESFLIVNMNINNKKILWMGNAVNPRTGLKGYKSEWTDEDFNDFFELTEEEIKQYKDYIKDFEERRNNWLEEHNRNK